MVFPFKMWSEAICFRRLGRFQMRGGQVALRGIFPRSGIGHWWFRCRKNSPGCRLSKPGCPACLSRNQTNAKSEAWKSAMLTFVKVIVLLKSSVITVSAPFMCIKPSTEL
jgi:hypothetical protein